MLRSTFGSASAWRSNLTRFTRTFCSNAILHEKPLPPRVVIPEGDLLESFLKGSGPGGQKINKTSSAVQLKHIPTGIVIKSQETRSRAQNRKIARRILSERLENIEKGPESRTALKAEKERKKKASASKKSNRKYRKLEGEQDGSGVEAGRREDDDDDSGSQVSEAMENGAVKDVLPHPDAHPSDAHIKSDPAR